MRNQTQWAAWIRETPQSEILEIRLWECDDSFRWYDESGADTEVSGATEESAIEAALEAWRTWGIQIIDLREGIES